MKKKRPKVIKPSSLLHNQYKLPKQMKVEGGKLVTIMGDPVLLDFKDGTLINVIENGVAQSIVDDAMMVRQDIPLAC